MKPTEKMLKKWEKERKEKEKKLLKDFRKNMTFDLVMKLKTDFDFFQRFNGSETLLSDYAKGQKELLDLIFKD